MSRCLKKDKDGNLCCNGFRFTPEYGAERCSNALCNWNLSKYTIIDVERRRLES